MAFVSSIALTQPNVSTRTTSSSSSSSCSTFHGRPSNIRVTVSPRERIPLHNLRIIPRCGDGDVSFPNVLDGSKFRVGIVRSRWNEDYISPMVADVKTSLLSCNVKEENIVEMQVPGAFEIPMAAKLMCATQKVDAVVCVGVLIEGETDHYSFIAQSVTSALMQIQLNANIPVIFGVLTCKTHEQTLARSSGDKAQAAAWGKTAVEMATLRASQVSPAVAGKKQVGF